MFAPDERQHRVGRRIAVAQQVRGLLQLQERSASSAAFVLRCADECCTLDMGETLFRAHKRSSCAFFPITGAISLVRRLQMDVTVEVAIIGSEGLVGVNIFTGAPQLHDGIVQGAGEAWRMPPRT